MDRSDLDLILLLSSSSASLERAPGDKDNWIERAGGQLPPYVRKLARGIMKSGKTMSQAIAIAISRIKKWAVGGDDVDADTVAKSVKALAEWTALKAKNAAGKIVKASSSDGDYLFLSNIGSFNTDLVRRAWTAHYRLNRPKLDDGYVSDSGYISELWTDHLIIENYDGETRYEKVPYSISGADVVFGEPQRVERSWVPVNDDLSLNEQKLLSAVLKMSAPSKHLERVRTLAQRG